MYAHLQVQNRSQQINDQALVTHFLFSFFFCKEKFIDAFVTF